MPPGIVPLPQRGSLTSTELGKSVSALISLGFRHIFVPEDLARLPAHVGQGDSPALKENDGINSALALKCLDPYA